MKMQSHDRLCFFWSHYKRLYREILHWFFFHLVLCSKKKKNGIKAANIFSPRTICILPIRYGWNLSSTHPKPHHSPRPFTLKQNKKKTVTWLHLFCDTHTQKKQGIVHILTNDSIYSNAISVADREEILRRTRVFYFNKYGGWPFYLFSTWTFFLGVFTYPTIYRTSGNSITLDEAREYEASSQEGPTPKSSTTVVPLPTSSSSDQLNNEEEPRILTFAELKDLIETGQLDQIPNNKVIPGGLNVRIPLPNE